MVGNYIISFRPWWIELLFVPPFPNADEQLVSAKDPTPHPFHLKYQGVVFEGASLSEPQPNLESLDNSRVIYILAHQATVGFFYFRVTIYNPDYAPSGPRARIGVDLIGVYELVKSHVGITGISGPCVASGSWLGPEGKRGVWIERSFDQLEGFVVAVSFNQSCPAGVRVESGDNLQELREVAPRIESTGGIFMVRAWDPTGG